MDPYSIDPSQHGTLEGIMPNLLVTQLYTQLHQGTLLTSHTHIHNSYIPQTEQHEPEGGMFCLGIVTHLLDVTPSNPLPHPLTPPPIQLRVI